MKYLPFLLTSLILSISTSYIFCSQQNNNQLRHAIDTTINDMHRVEIGLEAYENAFIEFKANFCHDTWHSTHAKNVNFLYTTAQKLGIFHTSMKEIFNHHTQLYKELENKINQKPYLQTIYQESLRNHQLRQEIKERIQNDASGKPTNPLTPENFNDYYHIVFSNIYITQNNQKNGLSRILSSNSETWMDELLKAESNDSLQAHCQQSCMDDFLDSSETIDTIESIESNNKTITPDNGTTSIESHSSTSPTSIDKKIYKQTSKVNSQLCSQILSQLIAQQKLTEDEFNQLSNYRKTTLLLQEYNSSSWPTLPANEKTYIENLIEERKNLQEADRISHSKNLKRQRKK